VKRSEINAVIREAIEFFRENRFALPPFAYWSAQQWREVPSGADEIRRCMLGWDVTDFGQGRFERLGLVLFTLRNGLPGEPASKPYCEKIMMVREEQVTPMHLHYRKMEDIINRGGGRLVLRFFRADSDQALDESAPVRLSIDGLAVEVSPGEEVVLEPGQSVTIPPMLYHDFWAQAGSGAVMAGEVSTGNDDKADNHFLDPLGRFPAIEEDEPAEFLLCSEYP